MDKLPTEILAAIFDYLDLKSAFLARSICKKALLAFAKWPVGKTIDEKLNDQVLHYFKLAKVIRLSNSTVTSHGLMGLKGHSIEHIVTPIGLDLTLEVAKVLHGIKRIIMYQPNSIERYALAALMPLDYLCIHGPISIYLEEIIGIRRLYIDTLREDEEHIAKMTNIEILAINRILFTREGQYDTFLAGLRHIAANGRLRIFNCSSLKIYDEIMAIINAKLAT
jgi:hypothetical protein